MAEIAAVLITKFLRDHGKRNVRIGEKPDGLAHLQFLDIFTEAGSCAAFYDPLDVAFAVIKKIGKLFQ